jgi:hypothetical protein
MRKAISVRSYGTMRDLLSDLAQHETPAQAILANAAEMMQQHPHIRLYCLEETLNVLDCNHCLTGPDLDKLQKSGVSVSVDAPIHDPDDDDEDEED